MKNVFMIMGLGLMSFLWGSEEMTIQVINAVHEKSITADFAEKVKKSGIISTKKIENGHHVVLLGKYKDRESAQKDLDKVRTVVMKDAFIRPVERHIVMAKETKPAVKTAASHEAQKVSADKPKSTVTSKPSETAITTVKVSEPEKKVEAKSVVSANQEVVKKPAVAPVTATPSVSAATEAKVAPVFASVVIMDRHDRRQQEIHEAIEYYKNSPYHRFEPVKMKP